MKLKINTSATITFLFIAMLTFYPKNSLGQKKSSYKMEFLRACSDSSEKGNVIMAVFRITPLIKNFKLILSMRVFYHLERGNKTINIIKEHEKNIRFFTFGTDIKEKYSKFYDFIKDRIKIKKEKDDVIYFAIIFDNVTKEKVDKMSITYGLWESNDNKVRNETKYDFEVETMKSGYVQDILTQVSQDTKK